MRSRMSTFCRSLKERFERVPGAEVVVGGDGDVDLVVVVVPEGDLQRVGLVGALGQLGRRRGGREHEVDGHFRGGGGRLGKTLLQQS